MNRRVLAVGLLVVVPLLGILLLNIGRDPHAGARPEPMHHDHENRDATQPIELLDEALREHIAAICHAGQ